MDSIEATEQPSRKRKNRWDSSEDAQQEITLSAENQPVNSSVSINDSNAGTTSTSIVSDVNVVPPDNGDDGTKRARKSRWGSTPAAADPVPVPVPLLSVPTMPMMPVVNAMSAECLQHIMVLQLQLQQVHQKLITVVADALRIEQDPNRSPSPPPKYDAHGKRTNTREVRMREALTKERVDLIEKLIKLNPSYQPPPDFVRTKPFRRIFIPKNSDPMVNYIGLIIGPRGMTQKDLETQTGCKISIRGKGSSKDGSKGRASKNIDEDEELHVHVQGEDDEKVAEACRRIEEILRPLDDTLNEHKQKQLKQLALINGTLRENEYCPVCGEKGHQQFDCPYRAKAFKAAGVKCSICGDLSHPTRDCPMRKEGPDNNESVIESEYDNFIAELTGGGSKPKKSAAENAGGSSDNMKTNSNNDDNGAKASKPAVQQTILTPIVDMFAKKQQTVIHVNTVLTGAAPPSFLSTTSSVSAPGDANTATAATASGYPSTAAWPSMPAPPVAPTTANLPVANTTVPASVPAPTPYGAYYPYNAYSSYYGYDASSMMAMQQQQSTAGGNFGAPPPPPPAPPLPSMMYAPPPPPPPAMPGFAPPPPPF